MTSHLYFCPRSQLEKRLEKQTRQLEEMEGQVAEGKKQHDVYKEAMDALQRDVVTMERENKRLKEDAQGGGVYVFGCACMRARV